MDWWLRHLVEAAIRRVVQDRLFPHLRSASGPNTNEGSAVDGSSPIGHQHRTYFAHISPLLIFVDDGQVSCDFRPPYRVSPRNHDGGDCSGSGGVDSAARNIHTLSVLSLRPVVYLHTSNSGDVSTAEWPFYAERNPDTKLDGEPATRSFSLDISPPGLTT